MFRITNSNFSRNLSLRINLWKLFSKSVHDPELVENLKQKIKDDQTFLNVDLTNFEQLYSGDDSKKAKISRIINVYDNMKYDLDDVPSSLSENDVVNLLEYEQISDIKRSLKKLYRKEIESLVKKQLRMLTNVNKNEFESSVEDRSGIFDSDGNLSYGLWHNTLVTRIPRTCRIRFSLDRLRNAELFGQNLFVDFSFSKYITQHMSAVIANDIGKMLTYNRFNSNEPYKITLCGIDYNHWLWKNLCKQFPNTIEITPHTSINFMDLCSEKSNLVYVTSMETKSFVEYDPNAHYVMAAISEKDLNEDFFTPAIRKLPIKRRGIPIDQYVIWNSGSKRLSLTNKVKLLTDIRQGMGWKEVLLKNVHSNNLKTIQQIESEDQQRFLNLSKKRLKSNKQK